ncbi:FkbM family methyltransferase [Microvirga tunisiensis]|uniref:FkbM family methyltransferase n=2 Tax=Pannonibacter tanglangensis TaxID=2750084 RepID=A0ABW9ZF93_9HYPH|nr:MULTISPECIES: FkbM family methyltransferase [unclassified Pannonibacter]NBN62728.1 FkbM family methyltransferase [Pannonibacter sp. XCT-34]NBN78383.1 FkbM family methyltransferase [Pannonibacter sp. XCT-53]
MRFEAFSQNLEDVLLWRVLRDVGAGFYIDVGAAHPVQDSVSLGFYRQGWRGFHVEPLPEMAAALRAARPGDRVFEAALSTRPGTVTFHRIDGTSGLSTGRADVAAAHSAAGHASETLTVPALSLAEVLDAAPGEVHWLKIDVEGMEQEVLESWGSSPVRPWVVAIETTVHSEAAVTENEVERQLGALGYRAMQFDGLNRFFLHQDHADRAGRFGLAANVFDDFIWYGGGASVALSRLAARATGLASLAQMALTGRLPEEAAPAGAPRTEAEIRTAYRLVLGREPESLAAMQPHFAQPDFWSLVRTFATSAEFDVIGQQARDLAALLDFRSPSEIARTQAAD